MPRFHVPLPYPGFQESVACYSDPTLRAVTGVLEKLRPQLARPPQYLRRQYQSLYFAWQPWPAACEALHQRCTAEQARRDAAPGSVERNPSRPGPYEMPYWVGWPALHQQHRGVLMFFGLVEQICDCAEAVYPTSHARENFYCQAGVRPGALLYQAPLTALLEVVELLDAQNAAPRPANFYAQYNWQVQPEPDLLVRYPHPKDKYYVA